jgi:hypothetical protein
VRIAIECRTPAIRQTQHGLAAPLIGFDISLGHTGFGNQQHFESAAAGFAVVAGDNWFQKVFCIYPIMRLMGFDHGIPDFLAGTPSLTLDVLIGTENKKPFRRRAF